MALTNVIYNESTVIWDQVWLNVIGRLRAEFGESVYKNWFCKLSLVEVKGDQLIFAVPSKFIKDWIQNNYAEYIIRFWNEIEGSVNSIEIIISEATATLDDIVEANNRQVANNPGSVIDSFELSFSQIDDRFTFETFVVGTPNELAYAAARSVAESNKVQAESNPLFLYGGVGLGKTHLMHAIAWHIKLHDPSRKVIYMSAEKFMYQFVKALRNKDIMSFKEQFRSVDVLMIDDVQFICGKDSTQEEFFHTFNALIDNNRQVVISCDRSPSDLDGMEERIKSRLGWGLVADVHSTTYELRLGILQSKVEQMQANVPKQVIEFLASKITSNVRELEGALNKVIAHSTLVGKEISLDNTQEILKDLLRSNERIVTIEDIQKKVAERFAIKISDMSSSRRLRTVARPRQIAMYLAKILTPKSLAEIGKKFGGKDHTTVMHAVKKVEELIQTDQELAEDIRLLTKILQS